jgi:hypothetical protein
VAGKPANTLADLTAATKEISAVAPAAPTLVGYDRKTERCLTVVKVGKDPCGRTPNCGKPASAATVVARHGRPAATRRPAGA